MTFLMVLAVTVAACLALRTPLHKWPVAFYVLAVAADVAYVIGVEGLLPRVVMGPLTLLMGKCVLSLALFVVVMYIGVFAKGSKVHQWLKPVRSELSIIACILACGHMAVYLGSYAPRLGGTLGVNVVSALVVALALLVLLLVLGVTSFAFVKRRMRTDSWKRLQRWAYVFFGLVYVHLMLMLAPAASQGGEAAVASVVVYTVIFGAYAALRVRRALVDRRADAAAATRVSPRTAQPSCFNWERLSWGWGSADAVGPRPCCWLRPRIPSRVAETCRTGTSSRFGEGQGRGFPASPSRFGSVRLFSEGTKTRLERSEGAWVAQEAAWQRLRRVPLWMWYN